MWTNWLVEYNVGGAGEVGGSYTTIHTLFEVYEWPQTTIEGLQDISLELRLISDQCLLFGTLCCGAHCLSS